MNFLPRCFAGILLFALARIARAQVSLEEAVDNPALVWITGGDKPWEGALAANAKSGGDLARCGPMTEEPYFSVADVSAWMETVVTGPATFRVFVRSNADPYLSTALSVDGREVVARTMEFDWEAVTTEWRALSCPLPPGSHTVRLTACLGCEGAGTIDLDGPTIEADLVEVLPVATAAGEAMDAPQFTWLTGGDPGYAVVNDVTHDGADALHSPAQFGSLWLQTEIEGPATVSWWRKGTAGVSIGGLGVAGGLREAWTRETAFVPPGTHAVRWDVENIYGEEVWLDAFVSVPEISVELSEALDAPGRTFTASTGWQGHTSAAAPDGADLASVRVTDEARWLETVVVGPAVVESLWRIRGTGADFSVSVDGQPVAGGHGLNAGENGGPHRLIVAPGSHVVRWEAAPYYWAPASMMLMLDAVNVLPVSLEALSTALDGSGLAWTTGGDSQWMGLTGALAHDATDMACSPALTEGKSAWLETTVTGPGSLSFQWQSLTQDSSTRRFLVDGQPVREYDAWSKPADWRRDAVEVSAGVHSIRIEANGPCGAGAILMDDVHFTAAAPPPVAAALDYLPTALYAEAGWVVDTSIHTDGLDSLRLEPANGYPGTTVTLWVNGPALLTLKTRSVEATMTLSSDGSLTRSTSGDWTTLTVAVPPGLRPVYLNSTASDNFAAPQHASWVDQVTVTSAALPLADALGTPGRMWRTNPANPWSGVAIGAGLPVRASPGPLNAASPSWLETTIAGPAVVTFIAHGHLQLLMNGARVAEINAAITEGPQPHAVWVPPGNVTLRWEDSLNSQKLPYLSAVTVREMIGEPSLARDGNSLLFTVPRPAGISDSRIVIEAGDRPDGLYNIFFSTPATIVRTNPQELVVRLPVEGANPRIFIRARFLP